MNNEIAPKPESYLNNLIEITNNIEHLSCYGAFISSYPRCNEPAHLRQ